MAVSRTLTYRRAVWKTRGRGPLQHLLVGVHQHLAQTRQRVFDYAGESLEGLAWAERMIEGESVAFFHLAQFKERQEAALVPKPSEIPLANTSELAPPEGKDFLGGDIMFLVANNDVLLCPSGAREATVSYYIDSIMQAAKRQNDISGLSLEAVADISTARLIASEGVRRIHLKSALYLATMVDETEHSRTSVRKNLLGSITGSLLDLFREDEDLNELGEKENLSVQLVISYDSRRRGGELGQQRIKSLADRLIEDDEDGFEIETREGKKISSHKLKLNRSVALPERGNSIDRTAAWDELASFYLDLKRSGTLEQ